MENILQTLLILSKIIDIREPRITIFVKLHNIYKGGRRMVEFLMQLVLCILCLYGLFSIIQDCVNFNTYKKLEENIKFVMTVKNVENGIEEYIRELTYGRNFYHNLVVIDMDSEDDTMEILHKLEREKFNMKVLDKEEGQKYLADMVN